MNLSLALSHARPGAQWSLTNDDLSTLDWRGPGDPPTMEELEAAWAQIKDRKGWPTVAEFWAEFSDSEKLSILDSTIGGIVLLREELRMWRGEVWSDDERVQQGLGGLVAVGILTAERREEILAR
jgi:hypothetical protein